MRILLDECLPAELAEYLIGHDVRTVHQENWKGIENGELLALAAGAFEAFVTIDRRLRRQPRIPAAVMVITLRARTNRINSLCTSAEDPPRSRAVCSGDLDSSAVRDSGRGGS